MGKQPKLIHNVCPYCGAEMTWDIMDFLRCPGCDSESHMSVDSPREYKKIALKATSSPPQYMHVKGPKSSSRSRKSKSAAKEKLKKQPTGALFQNLFKNT